MKLLRIFSAVIAAVFLAGCEALPEKYDEHFFAMNTIMSAEAYGAGAKKAVTEARERVEALEKIWSATDRNSEIFALNLGKSGAVSDETREIISFSLEMSEKTGGAFDPTVYPVLKAWGFTTGNYRVPERDELSRLLGSVGAKNVKISGNEIFLENGAEIDLGGVAKGCASDECAEIMRKNGIKSALINLGGNIYAVGNKPDGSPWRIGVTDPRGEGSVGTVSVSDKAVVTSGGYERYFIENGKTYCHIIDPKTGFPVDNDLLSATVIARSGRLCDALSTALFVMGREKAVEFWRETGGFDMILIAAGGEIVVSEGISDSFVSDRNVIVAN